MNRRSFLRTGLVGLGALALGAKFRPRAAEAKAAPRPVATSGYAQVEPINNSTVTITTTASPSMTNRTWVLVMDRDERKVWIEDKQTGEVVAPA